MPDLEECEPVCKRELFGGSISASFPVRFTDVSDIRQVPSHQEVFVDPNRDESIIVELLELKDDVQDHASAVWFLHDLAGDQDAEGTLLFESGRPLAASDAPLVDASTAMSSAVGQVGVSKNREGVEARNTVRVFVANLRLRNAQTDVLVSVYQPLVISEHSSSAVSVGPGSTTPAEHSGCMTASRVFSLVLRTFKIEDWSLFG